MGTEVLPPQDLLAARFHVSPAPFHRRRNFPSNGNLTPLIVNRMPIYNAAHRRTSPRPDKKKSDSAGTKRSINGGASETRRKDDGPAMGQVMILRRGESLDSLASKISGGKSNPRSPNRKSLDDMAVLGTSRFGPDSPEMIPKQIRFSPSSLPDVYAGSAFSLSPSPRSLPLPSFFNKKQETDGDEIDPSDNPATRDLRRLLRLDWGKPQSRICVAQIDSSDHVNGQP